MGLKMRLWAFVPPMPQKAVLVPGNLVKTWLDRYLICHKEAEYWAVQSVPQWLKDCGGSG